MKPGARIAAAEKSKRYAAAAEKSLNFAVAELAKVGEDGVTVHYSALSSLLAARALAQTAIAQLDIVEHAVKRSRR